MNVKRPLGGLAAATLLAAVTLARCAAPTPTVNGLTVTGTATFVHKNAVSGLTATANLSSGAPQVVTSQATWTSSDPDVAIVSSAGVVTSQGNGTAIITATYAGKTGTLAVVVTLTSLPQISTVFQRLCSPHRARITFSISEGNGDVGFTLTALSVSMVLFGTSQVFHVFDPTEFATAFGSTHFNPGQTKVLAYESAYPGGVEVSDSTAIIDWQTIDDEGHTKNIRQTDDFMHDGC